jgi:hypothetical protein
VARSLRIVLDIDPLSAPLEGALSTESRSSREFVGLVELLAALEEVVRQERPNGEVASWPGIGQ